MPGVGLTQPVGNLSSNSFVLYKSDGKLLVIAECHKLAAMLENIPATLNVFLFLKGPCPRALEKYLTGRGICWLENIEEIQVRGYLGNFRVEADIEHKSRQDRLTVASSPLTADVILDLLDPPVVLQSIPPIGYFSKLPSGDEGKKAIAQLGQWVGEFEKPKFFDFNSRLCAHQFSGILGCTACIDRCATQAISSENGKIGINPYLCQGCGDCAAVCPSGAIRYNYPPPEITLDKLRKELAVRKSQVVLFHDSEAGNRWITEYRESLQENILPFELESNGAIGSDIWLSALAYGASAVLILVAENLNPQTDQAINSQVHYANEILHGAGIRPAIKMVVNMDAIESSLDGFQESLLPCPATFTGLRDKRTVIRLALDYLTENRKSLPLHTTLSAGAPFGEIVVDSDLCTLCMACVSVCPESALMDGFDEPKLSFIEANCVQCGICRKACPENAIELVPRYLYNSLDARKARLLNEDQPFNCIECGKPFATAKVIQAITGKLESHPMFQGNHLQRLRTCEDCRVKSFFSTSKAGG